VLEKIPPVIEEMLKNLHLLAMCHGPVKSLRPLFVAEILHQLLTVKAATWISVACFRTRNCLMVYTGKSALASYIMVTQCTR
jgi:hypothetical protein